MSTIVVETATRADLDDACALFEAYRAFYRRAPDREGARAFLAERLARGESVIFLARRDGEAVGFAQLFPMFSTLRLARTWILEDLYVASSARRLGVGAAVLARAETFARSAGADALSLTTAIDNHDAQRLYASAGWVRDDEFFTYHRILER